MAKNAMKTMKAKAMKLAMKAMKKKAMKAMKAVRVVRAAPAVEAVPAVEDVAAAPVVLPLHPLGPPPFRLMVAHSPTPVGRPLGRRLVDIPDPIVVQYRYP
jgi:hypothetical protein